MSCTTNCVSKKWFGDLSNQTAEPICIFYCDFNHIVHTTWQDYGVHVSLFCALINIFHITVLLQKSMRVSSIFLIMAAVALMDICMLVYTLTKAAMSFYQIMSLCYSATADYNVMTTLMVTEYMRNYARRCSTWFSLSITIIRTLVMRHPMSAEIEILSRPKAALFIIGGVMSIIIPINLIDVFRLSVNVAHPKYICSEYGMGNEFRFFDVTRSSYFKTHFEIVQTYYKIIDGISTKMIPCILFPVATVFLIIEIRKANFRRKKLSSSSVSSNSIDTSYLVLAQTLTFIISELPLGTIFLLQSIFLEDSYYGLYELLISFEIFFTVIQCAATSSHMIICLFMSSQYRMNALMIFRCGYPLKYIPLTLYPIFTLILILELRKATIQRKKMASNSAANSSIDTSNLVLAQTITIFISELPMGTIFLLQSILLEKTNYGLYELLILFEVFFTVLTALPTLSHMIICLLMSSQYRSNALMMIRCGYPVQGKKKEVESVLTVNLNV